jgi:predicted TIM-barrel fold metal-dependent hydrolase
MDIFVSSIIENDIVIQFHTGKDKASPQAFDWFVRKFGKRIKIHFIHMGGSSVGHLKFIPKFIEWLSAGYQVYTDFSWARGFGPKYLLQSLKLNELKTNNILFASDEPWGDFKLELFRLFTLDLSLAERRNILYNNAYKLYLEK